MVRLLIPLLLLFVALGLGGVEYDPGDATPDYHTCDSGADIDDMGAMTVAVWNVSDVDDEANSLVTKGQDIAVGWVFMQRGDGGFCPGFYATTDGDDLFGVAEGGNCSKDTLQHFAVTWTGVVGVFADQVVLYYNGAVASGLGMSQNGTGTYESDAAVSLIIGATTGETVLWDGDLQCVAIWDTVLTAEEIATIASGSCRAALKVQSANLLRLYEMNEGEIGAAATTLHDTVSDNTCTANDSETWEPLAVSH